MELLDVVAVEGRVRRGGDLINHVGDVGEGDDMTATGTRRRTRTRPRGPARGNRSTAQIVLS